MHRAISPLFRNPVRAGANIFDARVGTRIQVFASVANLQLALVAILHEPIIATRTQSGPVHRAGTSYSPVVANAHRGSCLTGTIRIQLVPAVTRLALCGVVGRALGQRCPDAVRARANICGADVSVFVVPVVARIADVGHVSSASSSAGAHRNTIIAGANIAHARARAARTSIQVFASVADQQLALVAVLHEAIVATVARS